jgi:signal transduction histidine kinase
MLYLKLPAGPDGAASGPRLPVSPEAVSIFERAVLAADAGSTKREINQLLAIDSNVASWAMRRAEAALDRTINRIEEAGQWLAERLIAELADGLTIENAPVAEVEWRLHRLVHKLRAYEQQIEAFEARLEHEKLESLKELAYGASHEINNPLANIAARAQTLLDDEEEPERRRKLTAIHRQAMRAHEMIADLMLFARPPKLVLARCELRQLVLKVVGELRELASETESELVYEFAGNPLELTADATQLGVAIHAVLLNALEAAGNGGRVEVSVAITGSRDDTKAEITVSDNGPGISEQVRGHMFDPFFSGREAGRGLGFGLSKCWRIVTDHGGEIAVKRSGSGGAEISLLLPLEGRGAAKS